MAELGSIRTIDINRGVDPARGDFAGALETALGVGKKIAGEVIGANLEEDLNETLQKALDTETPEIIDPRGRDTLEAGTNQEIPLIEAEIDMLNQRILQGKGNKVDAAKLELQAKLASAQAKHPAFAQSLAQRAGVTVDKSNVLYELALEDAAQAAKAGQAQAHLDDITQRWQDLGVPIEQLGTTQGSKEYTKRSNKQARISANTQDLQLIIGSREMDGQRALESWTKNTNTEYGQAAVKVGDLMSRPGGYNDVVAELSKPEAQRNNTLIDTWLTSGRAADAQEFQKVLLGIQQVGGELFRKDPGLRSTKAGQDILAQTDDIVAQLTRAGQLLTSEKAPTPSSLQLGKMEQEWRVMALFNKADPSVRQLNDTISSTYVNGENFLKIFPYIIGADDIVGKHELGRIAGSALSTLIPGYTQGTPLSTTERATLHLAAGGEGQITPDMPAAEINHTLRNITTQREKTLLLDTVGEDELVLEAHAQINEAGVFFKAAQQVNELSTPTFAAKTLTNMNEAMQILTMTGRFNEGQIRDIRSTLANPELLEAITKAGDSEGAQQRLAFGITANDLYAATKPGNQRRAALADYNAKADNGTLKDFVLWTDENVAKMRDEGVISYKFNEPRIREAALRQAGPNAVQYLKYPNDPTFLALQNGIRERTRARMDAIVGFANKDVRAEAHIEAAKAPSVEGDFKPRYVVKINQLGWFDGLLQ